MADTDLQAQAEAREKTTTTGTQRIVDGRTGGRELIEADATHNAPVRGFCRETQQPQQQQQQHNQTRQAFTEVILYSLQEKGNGASLCTGLQNSLAIFQSLSRSLSLSLAV